MDMAWRPVRQQVLMVVVVVIRGVVMVILRVMRVMVVVVILRTGATTTVVRLQQLRRKLPPKVGVLGGVRQHLPKVQGRWLSGCRGHRTVRLLLLNSRATTSSSDMTEQRAKGIVESSSSSGRTSTSGLVEGRLDGLRLQRPVQRHVHLKLGGDAKLGRALITGKGGGGGGGSGLLNSTSAQQKAQIRSLASSSCSSMSRVDIGHMGGHLIQRGKGDTAQAALEEDKGGVRGEIDRLEDRNEQPLRANADRTVAGQIERWFAQKRGGIG